MMPFEAVGHVRRLFCLVAVSAWGGEQRARDGPTRRVAPERDPYSHI